MLNKEFPILEFDKVSDNSCGSGDEWNSRREIDRKSIRETLFWFSVEASLKL